MPLDETQIEKLRLTLAGSGWKDVMEPVIAKRAHDAVKALVLHPSERSGEFSKLDDHEIRARIKENEWILTVWKNEINVYDLNRMGEELARRNQDGPAGGAPGDPTPANP